MGIVPLNEPIRRFDVVTKEGIRVRTAFRPWKCRKCKQTFAPGTTRWDYGVMFDPKGFAPTGEYDTQHAHCTNCMNTSIQEMQKDIELFIKDPDSFRLLKKL